MFYDIVLVMVPPWELKRPPLGPAYIVEYLKSRDFKVKMLDFNLELYKKISKDRKIFWEISNINSMHPSEIACKMFSFFRDEIELLVERIISFDCRMVGFSVNVASIGLAGKISTLIKERDKNKIIIFGGTGCFWEHDRRLIFPEDIKSIDIFVIGDGEEVLEKIIKRREENFDNIEGLIWQNAGADIFKPAVPYYTKDIDKLPFPKFCDFDLDGYTMKQLPMLISRGCIGRCVYCIDRLMCGSYRCRSPEKVLEEIQYHVSINKINDFGFNDLICNGNLNQLENICEGIVRLGLNIVWGSYAMIRKGMTFELLKKMRRAGCIFLCYGLESGCDHTLKRMNKYYVGQDAQGIIEATHKAGIQTAVNIIVGFPGETEEDFKETLSFIKNNKDYIYEITNVSSFVIMPGSMLGRSPQNYGVKLPPSNKDLNLYIDNNNLDLKGRIKRVREAIFLILNLGIRNVIINQPGLRRDTKEKTIVLLHLPPARVDLPVLEIAGFYSYLQNEKFRPIIYDFNIRLYNSVCDDLKYLWDYDNWYVWSYYPQIYDKSKRLEDNIFNLINEVICLETDVFYFYVNRDNFIFSLKTAAIIKKWVSSKITIIFAGSIFMDKEISAMMTRDIVDLSFFDNEGDSLCGILRGDKTVICDTSDSVIHERGAGRNIDKKLDSINKRLNINFEGFNLNEYKGLRLPLLWRES